MQLNNSLRPRKHLLAAAILSITFSHSYAKPPSQDVVNACLLVEDRTAKGVKYTSIPLTGITDNDIDNLDDKDEKKTSTVIDIAKDEFGVWRTASPKAYGLVYNGKEINIKKVKSLTKQTKPTEIDVGMAVTGIAQAGTDAFVCVAFLFDGFGGSGSFQNVLQAYIIDRNAKTFMPYYAVGDVRAFRQNAGGTSAVAGALTVRHPVGVWLSLVERCVRDAEAGGSNPFTPTRKYPP